MKRYFLLFGSLNFLIFFISEVRGQIVEEDIPHGEWSVAILSGFEYSPSSAMQGTIQDYQNALRTGTTATQFPFGTRPYTVGFEAQVEYRYAKSPLSLYFTGYGSSYNAGYGFRFSPGGRYTMTIASGTIGLEYTFGQIYQHWNFFGRFGLSSNIIASSYRTGGANRFSDTSINATGQRFGIEIEAGERYNFPRLPFGIEASINYANVNLIGKTYTKPLIFGNFGGNQEINDGKNPSDASDNARVIDYFSLRLGARFYF
jgi:hypothetical protein